MPGPNSPWRERLLAWARVQVVTRLEARSRPRLVAAGAAAGALIAVGAGFATGAVGPASPGQLPLPEIVLPRVGAGPAGPGTGTGPGSGARPAGATPGRAAGAAGTGVAASGTGATDAPSVLVVHAAGAVNRAGLVRVPGPARVIDVVEAAGGLAADADRDALNLAAPVADGQRVFVPRRGQATPAVADIDPDPDPNVVSGGPAGGAGEAAGSAVVNLNTATATELETLPGVGPATAARIVEYRSGHGPFRSAEQLLEVPGIGPAKLAAIRPRVRT